MSESGGGAGRAAPRGRRRPIWRRLLADRGAVLIIGVCVGAAIGLAFGGGGLRHAAAPAAQNKAVAAALPADCAVRVAPRLVARLRKGEPAVVGVLGDSFGDGYYASLYQQLGQQIGGKDVRVVKLSREGTGFTRYHVSDVQAEAARRLKDEPLDVAVLAFGANDTEGIWDDAHKHAYVFMTPQWKAVYGQRMARLVGLLREQGAMVYWVGLPKMRTPKYDADIAAEMAFYAEEMKSLDVPFFDTRAASSDAQGEFNIYLPDGPSGTPKVMRANDGIHMNFIGYERLSAPVAERVRAYIARAARAAQEAQAQPSGSETAGSGS